MRSDTFTFAADDGKALFVRRWRPAAGAPEKAIVHIAHGMAEHGGRYARFAAALVEAGYVTYANDHRGHGRTAEPDELGWLGVDGVRRCVSDLRQLVAFEKQENGGLPLVVFGHSMGSYFTQALAIEDGAAFRGVVLCGTGGKPSLLASAGRVVARAERLRLGPRSPSALLRALSFDAFNRAFEPNRTAYDWLSRDEAEVDAYAADPRCGFSVSTQLWVDLLDTIARIARPEEQARIPRALPIHVICGAEDPAGEHAKSPRRLLEAYRRAGMENVTHRFYPGARHELLNETNRDEVTRDVIDWLDAACR